MSAEVLRGDKKAGAIPERRPSPEDRRKSIPVKEEQPVGRLNYPVWRCKVCGYLCARDNPPEVCPVCKASSDRFERFM